MPFYAALAERTFLKFDCSFALSTTLVGSSIRVTRIQVPSWFGLLRILDPLVDEASVDQVVAVMAKLVVGRAEQRFDCVLSLERLLDDAELVLAVSAKRESAAYLC